MRIYPDRAVIEEVFTEIQWVTGNRYVVEPYEDIEFEYEDGYANPVYVDAGISYHQCCGLSGACPNGERSCVPFHRLPGEVKRDVLRCDVNWWDHDQRQGFTVAQRDLVIENVISGKMPNRWLEGVQIEEASADKRLTTRSPRAAILDFPAPAPAPAPTKRRDRGIDMDR